MKRLFFAVALAALSAATDAQTLDVVLFTTVDSVRVEAGRLYVSGVVDGETEPREAYFVFATSYPIYISQLEACERLSLLAMTKPGQYQVRIQQANSSHAKCALIRVAP